MNILELQHKITKIKNEIDELKSRFVGAEERIVKHKRMKNGREKSIGDPDTW